MWTELTLYREDIEEKAESCSMLIERCKNLASLEILNKLEIWGFDSPLNIMSVVIRAKDTLKRLEVDKTMAIWTNAEMAKLGQMENLTGLSMAFCSKGDDSTSPQMLEELAKLYKLEVLNLSIHSFYSSNCSSLRFLKSVFEKLNKLKIVKIDVPIPEYDESLVTTLVESNPDLRELHMAKVTMDQVERLNESLIKYPNLRIYCQLS